MSVTGNGQVPSSGGFSMMVGAGGEVAGHGGSGAAKGNQGDPSAPILSKLLSLSKKSKRLDIIHGIILLTGLFFGYMEGEYLDTTTLTVPLISQVFRLVNTLSTPALGRLLIIRKSTSHTDITGWK